MIERPPSLHCNHLMQAQVAPGRRQRRRRGGRGRRARRKRRRGQRAAAHSDRFLPPKHRPPDQAARHASVMSSFGIGRPGIIFDGPAAPSTYNQGCHPYVTFALRTVCKTHMQFPLNFLIGADVIWMASCLVPLMSQESIKLLATFFWPSPWT